VKLTVGMELWWVPANQYRNKESVRVEKVGRKWATLSNGHRIDVSNLHGDCEGYSSPGRAWPSQADHEAYMGIVIAWRDLRNDIYKMWTAPAEIDVQTINVVRKTIGLEVASALTQTGGSDVETS